MSESGPEVWITAPAKINLYLHVTGKRADGYHVLDSLIAFADFGDRITAAPAHSLGLEIDGPFAGALQEATPNPDANLVLRAARALADYAGRPAAAHIQLTKNLPIAAGIGGGSADAAAALRALAELWQLPWDEAAMGALAAALGADVPVCLAGYAAFVGGIGEIITPAPPLPDCGLVLLNPGVTLPTAEVFAARSGDFGAAARFTETPADAAGLARLLAPRRNDLSAAAIAIQLVIADALAALQGAGAHLARLSGSGATCFGLFDDLDAAIAAAESLGRAAPEWWLAATTLASP